MSILKLAAMLTLDGTSFKAGLKEAEVASGKFASNIGSSLKGQLAGVFGAGALVAFVGNALKSTAALQDLSEQAHMSTDDVQRFTAAAEHMGLTFNDVAAAERQFNQNRREAVEGNEEKRASFERLGMSLEDVNDSNLTFTDFMKRANVAMQGMDVDEKQRSLTMLADVLGTRVGPRLQEFIKQLHEVKDLPIIDKKTIKDLDEASDKMGDVFRIMKGMISMGIVSPAKAFKQSTDIVGQSILGAVDWATGFKYGLTGEIDGSALPMRGKPLHKINNKVDAETERERNRIGDMVWRQIDEELAEQDKKAPTVKGVDRSAQLGVSSLTSVGQWSGRNLIGTGGGNDPTEKLRKEQEKTTQAVVKLTEKLKPRTLIAVP